MKPLRFSLALALTLIALPALGAVWTDEFDADELNEAWDVITDRPGKQSTVSIEDGRLLINEPLGNFGHLITDGRPLVLRDAPSGAFSISARFDTDPPTPAGDYWVGLFIIGDAKNDATMARNWSVLTLGGSKGEVKVLIGSMIENAWNDKGHFDVPEWPIYLKLEKDGKQLNGFHKGKENDDWMQVGASWADSMENPAKVGIGFINNWGGTNLTLIVDFFTLEGDNVEAFAVEPAGKLSTTWAEIKDR